MDVPTLLQIEGIGLNTATLGVVTTIVLGLTGVITLLFKWATSNQERELARIEADKAREVTRLEGELRQEREDNQHLLDTLIDVLRTAHRSTDAADEATQELLKRRARKPTR